MDKLTSQELIYCAAGLRGLIRQAEADAVRFPVGHASRLIFERAVETYRALIAKLQEMADSAPAA